MLRRRGLPGWFVPHVRFRSGGKYYSGRLSSVVCNFLCQGPFGQAILGVGCLGSPKAPKFRLNARINRGLSNATAAGNCAAQPTRISDKVQPAHHEA